MADKSKTNSVVFEALIKDRVFYAAAHSVVTERLVGNAYGYAAVATAYKVVRESLIKLAPIGAGNVVFEVLVDMPSDLSTEARMAGMLRQTVVIPRPPMPDPGDVWSNTAVPSYRELVVVDKPPGTRPRSDSRALTLRALTMIGRATISPADTWSPLRTNTLVMQIVQSRNNVYIPVSALYVRVQRQQVVVQRVSPEAPDVWSPITASTLVQHIVQSRVNEAPTILTMAFTGLLRMQVVRHANRPAPWSENSVSVLRMQVVQAREVMPPGIDERVSRLMQQALMRRTPTPPNGGEHVAGQRQLVVTHRDTYPPAFAMGRNVASLRAEVIMGRTLGPWPWGQVQVSSMRLFFALGRTVPLPADVIDPATGRHVVIYRQLAVQHRVTVPPDVSFRALRYVFGVARQVVLGDVFPPPDYPPPDDAGVTVRNLAQRVVMRDDEGWDIMSAVKAHSVAESVVHGDVGPWDDPLVPSSDIEAFNVIERVVHGTSYPDPLLPHSEIAVDTLNEVAVVGDPSFLDPSIPQSEIQVGAVIELPIVTDTTWSDPTIPTSDVIVSRLSQHAVMHDDELTGTFQMSEIKIVVMGAFAVVRDPYLVGVPKRTGPRPIVSVAIS